MVTATNQLTIIASLQDRLTKPLMGIEKSTARLDKQFTKLSGAVQNAFQFYVRYRIFSLINQGISAIENAIPGLIARGQEWARTVDDISDSTGLAAEKSSLLAGVMSVMVGDAQGLTRALGAVANNAANHSDVFKRYGIAVQNTNGQLLDSWTILMNVRKALSDVGNGFITTAAARELFSRGGQVLIDFLTMSDAQFKLLTKDVRESGVIMTDAGLRAAEAWGRTQRRFEQQVTGIANQITQTVQPLLTRLVDGITNYLRQNMASIVGFVTEVVSFVAHAVAGFLGIDISGQVQTMAEQMDALAEGSNKRERALSKTAKARDEQTESEDGYSKALESQIDAIDRQLEAMSRVDDAEDARREHMRLMQDIADARKELRDLRGESIFAAGMSAAEAELARQAHAADIVDAQKRIGEAQQKLEEQERDRAREMRRDDLEDRKAMLQQRLAAHIKTLADEAAADREAMGQIFGPDAGGFGGITDNIKKVMAAGREGLLKGELGKQWGEDFRASLDGFFRDLNNPTTGLGAAFSSIASVAKLVADNWMLVAAAGAAIIALNLATSLGRLAIAIGSILALIPGAGVAAGVGAGAAKGAGALGAAGAVAKAGGGGLLALLMGREVASAAFGKSFGAAQPMIDNINRQGDEAFDRLVAGTQKTLQDTANSLFGPGTFIGGITGANAAQNITSAVATGARTSERLAAQQGTLATALGPDGTMADVATSAERTEDAVAPYGGRTLAQYLQRISANTGTLASQPLGVANLELNVDRKTILQMLGVPIKRGTSTQKRQ